MYVKRKEHKNSWFSSSTNLSIAITILAKLNHPMDKRWKNVDSHESWVIGFSIMDVSL